MSSGCQLRSRRSRFRTYRGQYDYCHLCPSQGFFSLPRRICSSETYVSHLPVLTHQSVKHSLLTAPSSKELFVEQVIESSLTKVMGDSQLLLLCSLSSKGGKQSASPASSSGQRRICSLYGRFSSPSRPFSSHSHGTKRSSSSLPARMLKVSFGGIMHSPTP